MRVVIFCHSLLSDWNHGNAHFLRGVATELLARGHGVTVYEPRTAWSVRNLVAHEGRDALRAFTVVYPHLDPQRYDPVTLDLDLALDGADLVLVHEWSSPELVRRVGQHRARTRAYRLLFHDTHHRAVSDPAAMARFDLAHYDGVLAFGRILRDLYLARGWAGRAWTWHEAADTRVFYPRQGETPAGDVVWIGNWGDGERTAEIQRFLMRPVRDLGLRGQVYGVRYPPEAQQQLRRAGIEYGGWLPNFEVPRVFGRFRVTVHIPRDPYARALPGIPTIRPFEALACGIPMVSAPWRDTEGLFRAGTDFLMARTPLEMTRHLRALLRDEAMARELAASGRRTVLARHTCAHRVDELLEIHAELTGARMAASVA
jgi:spore maturation protein CgeB